MKIKDYVLDLYNRYHGKGTIITIIVIVVILLISIKKVPILRKFFGNIFKLLTLPFRKIVSLFRKAPVLLETYLASNVSLKLLEDRKTREEVERSKYEKKILDKIKNEVIKSAEELAEEYKRKSKSIQSEDVSFFLDFLGNVFSNMIEILKRARFLSSSTLISNIHDSLHNAFYIEFEKHRVDNLRLEIFKSKVFLSNDERKLLLTFDVENDVKIIGDFISTVKRYRDDVVFEKNGEIIDVDEKTYIIFAAEKYLFSFGKDVFKILQIRYVEKIIKSVTDKAFKETESFDDFIKSERGTSLLGKAKYAISRIKEYVVDMYENNTTLTIISVISLFVLIYIAIKKIPILRKFFGSIMKLLLLPFRKIISFFKKIPALFESYSSNQVSRRLIETKIKEMDMYTTMYLLV